VPGGRHGAVTLTGEWDDLISTLDPQRFRARLARQLVTAHNRIGRDFRRTAQGLIRAAVYAPNSPMTIALKGSSKPLVHRGDLYQSIGYALDGPYTLQLGLVKRKVGPEVVNVGLVLHEGATIDVSRHPQVRRKVWAMVRESLGKDRLNSLNPKSRRAVIKAGSTLGVGRRKGGISDRQRRAIFASMRAKGKISGGSGSKARQVWVIPARPFLLRPAQDSTFHRAILTHYTAAVRAAYGG